MSPSEKAKPQPLTPPLSDRLEQQYLPPSNSASPYQHSPFDLDNVPQMPPYSQTAFSSPEYHPGRIDPYRQEPYPNAFHGHDSYQAPFQGQPDSGLGFQYDQFGAPVYYTPQNVAYTYPLPQQLYPNPPYIASSPPTPAASNQSGDKRRTKKTTRTATKANRKNESDEETPHKKKKGAKQSTMDKSKIPKLTAPLSELTEGFNHIPIKDMDAWARRPKEKRLTERGKGGKISRPMNSFILYRSAYAERCKVWCSQNNHQVVSTVCGQSWALEGPEVKKLYTDYAQLERENHAKAHPDYRFSPSKATTKGRKRKRPASEDDDDEEPSDLDDPSYDYRPSAAKQGKTRAKTPGSVATFPVSQRGGYNNEGDNGRERSTFQYNNPGKPPPLPIGAHDLQPGEYWRSTVVPHARGHQYVEDVLVHKTDAPSAQHGPAPSLSAVPGATHHDLLEGQSIESSGASILEPALDPSLPEFNIDYNSSAPDFVPDPNFEDFGQAGFSYDNGQQSMAPLIEGYPATADTYEPDLDSWPLPPTDPPDAMENYGSWMQQNNDRGDR